MKAKLPARNLGLLAALAAVLLVAGCSVQETHDQGGSKKVAIKTPIGSLKVNTDVDAGDTGLPVFPGATRKEKSDSDKGAANVNINSDLFGLKVAVIEFQTDQPPEKVLDFYKDKLKTYGSVLECRDTGFITYNRKDPGSDRGSDQVTCDKREHRGDAVQLKVGTQDRQHIVAVKPHGDGSEFALVYVQTRGKQGTM